MLPLKVGRQIRYTESDTEYPRRLESFLLTDEIADLSESITDRNIDSACRKLWQLLHLDRDTVAPARHRETTDNFDIFLGSLNSF
jgi:hypothetical protein